MQTEEMIPADVFCVHHNIELSFIYTLKECGLLEIGSREEKIYIPVSQLPLLEKLLRLYEMDINIEGLETINYLLQRLDEQQEKIITLTNRLRRYESDDAI